MGWAGQLTLHYTNREGRTVGHDRHDGPLRVLRSLYPEGPAVCHQVLVHPPGGIVGGDRLQVDIDVGAGAHALVTTPGATRFYRSAGEEARQDVSLILAEGARLEWLPLEGIVYDGARSFNGLRMRLAPGARSIGWDTLALGLPASGEPFLRGEHVQRLALEGVWLEQGRVRAADTRLLDSPIGWAGHRVLATLWAVAGDARPGSEVDALLDAAREAIEASPLRGQAGVTALAAGRGAVLRVLAHRVEPAQQLLQSVWAAWRPDWIGAPAMTPRIWRT